MNDVLLEIAKIGGPVVLVVGLFLKFGIQPLLTYMAAERVAGEKRDAAFLSTLQQLNAHAATRADECHKVHAESIRTIEKNTAALEQFAESQNEMTQALERLAERT